MPGQPAPIRQGKAVSSDNSAVLLFIFGLERFRLWSGLAVGINRVYCCSLSEGQEAMNQNSRRATARAIAITRADESHAKKMIATRLTVIALCAIAAFAALPLLWSF
jgi:hypothetical protein